MTGFELSMCFCTHGLNNYTRFNSIINITLHKDYTKGNDIIYAESWQNPYDKIVPILGISAKTIHGNIFSTWSMTAGVS